MNIRLDSGLLEKYPGTTIGYMSAQVCVRKKHEYLDSLKSELKASLSKRGIDNTNFGRNPDLLNWRKIYEEDFLVKAKEFPSSIESLVRRVLSGKGIWNINSIVDIYNCCSVQSLLPFGAYDLNKISGDIAIRYARETETFLGLGLKNRVHMKANQVVYADDQKILCWLWNHKDSVESCIDETSKHVVFFIDAFDEYKVQLALEYLNDQLTKIDCIPLKSGILTNSLPEASLLWRA